jgi:prepilin peptidase CpaA
VSAELRLVGDLLCVVLCLLSAGFDLRTRRIPHFLTMPALAAGFVLSFLGGGVYGLAGAALAVLLLAGVLALFAAAGGVGWGDVALMAAVGALLGWPLPAWPLVLYALLYTALVGGALAIVVAARQHRLRAALKAAVTLPRAGGQKQGSGVTIPYGVAIAAGTLWAVAGRYLPSLVIG